MSDQAQTTDHTWLHARMCAVYVVAIAVGLTMRLPYHAELIQVALCGVLLPWRLIKLVEAMRANKKCPD